MGYKANQDAGIAKKVFWSPWLKTKVGILRNGAILQEIDIRDLTIFMKVLTKGDGKSHPSGKIPPK